MDLGRELVACALREGSLRPFIDAGLTSEWLTDEQDPSRAAVFDSEDLRAWTTLTRHWDQHRKVPSIDLFQRSHPDEAYRLPKSSYTSDELVEIFQRDRRRYLTQLAVSDLSDRITEGRIDDAISLMEQAARMIQRTYASQSIVVTWDDPEYDVEGRIAREITQGIPTGIPGFDDQEGFNGFQRGWMVCYLGRAKAGKTSYALLSALRAWELGKRVLFVSFEIAAGRTPDEPGVADRLDSMGASIDMLKYMQGELSKNDQEQLREFRDEMALNRSDAFKIIQPTGRYTVDDLEAQIDQYEPDVVYVDGFYFMVDRITGHRGSHWEGHDNLAEELKSLAMTRMVTVIITHQVREKQLQGTKGKGIDDGAMMGGTGITMAADMVIGADVDDKFNRTLTTTRSRLKYLDQVCGVWDWTTCMFKEQAPQVDTNAFDYGKDDNADAPF